MFKGIRKLMGSWPSTAQDFMERGWQLESEGKPGEAIEDFTQAIDIEERDSRNLEKLLNYYTCRAETSLESGRYEQCRDDCDTLLKMLDEYYETFYADDKSKYRQQCKDSQVADTLYNRAQAMMGLGNRDQALHNLNQSLAAFGDDPIDYARTFHVAVELRARILFERGDLDAALADCNRVIDWVEYYDDSIEPAYRIRSRIHRAKNDHDSAAKDEATADALLRGEEWESSSTPSRSVSTQPVSQPADSTVEVERFGNGELTIGIPPAGLMKGSKGLFPMGVIWTLFSLGVGSVFLAAAFSDESLLSLAFPCGLVGLFVVIGIALTLGGYNMGTRRAAFAVIGGEMSVIRSGIFGTKAYRWPVDQVENVNVAASGMTVNDVQVMQLSISTTDDELGMLSGRDDQELSWIANELNLAVNAARKTG